MCLTCILIPVLIGLICALLGYLLGKFLSEKSVAALRADLDACRSNSLKLEETIKGLRAELSTSKRSVAAPVLIPFSAQAAASVFGKKVLQDDLKIIEGIGPKIEEMFHAAGIKTWKALSETSAEKCRQILESGGESFAVHDPSTWPKQSELAYEGKWQHLKDWQDKLEGGKA
jgi:predicted flap endonuclease-1-like 5' DNA nuclease